LTLTLKYGVTRQREHPKGPEAHNPLHESLADLREDLDPGSSIAQTNHGLQSPAGEAHDIESLTDTPPSQPDTKKCMQIGSETYAVTSQPGTPYTFDPRIDAESILGQRLQPITEIPEPTTQELTRRKSMKPQKLNRHKNRRHNTQGRVMDKFSSASRQ
jgi:hypothetical protein